MDLHTRHLLQLALRGIKWQKLLIFSCTVDSPCFQTSNHQTSSKYSILQTPPLQIMGHLLWNESAFFKWLTTIDMSLFWSRIHCIPLSPVAVWRKHGNGGSMTFLLILSIWGHESGNHFHANQFLLIYLDFYSFLYPLTHETFHSDHYWNSSSLLSVSLIGLTTSDLTSEWFLLWSVSSHLILALRWLGIPEHWSNTSDFFGPLCLPVCVVAFCLHKKWMEILLWMSFLLNSLLQVSAQLQLFFLIHCQIIGASLDNGLCSKPSRSWLPTPHHRAVSSDNYCNHQMLSALGNLCTHPTTNSREMIK